MEKGLPIFRESLCFSFLRKEKQQKKSTFLLGDGGEGLHFVISAYISISRATQSLSVLTEPQKP